MQKGHCLVHDLRTRIINETLEEDVTSSRAYSIMLKQIRAFITRLMHPLLYYLFKVKEKWSVSVGSGWRE